MNLISYNAILLAAIMIPFIIVFLVIWRCLDNSKKESIILIVLKGMITRRNVGDAPMLLFQGRIVDPKSFTSHSAWLRPFGAMRAFFLVAIFFVSNSIQTTVTLVIFQVSYECNADPYLDCFLQHFDADVRPPWREYPVNCSAISHTELVVCYKLVILEPEYWFIAATSGYLLMKIMRVILDLFASFLLWAADRGMGFLKKIKRGIYIAFAIILGIVLFLSIYVEEFENATQKISWAHLIQIVFTVFLLPFSAFSIPWEDFANEAEYVDDASLLVVLHSSQETTPPFHRPEINEVIELG